MKKLAETAAHCVIKQWCWSLVLEFHKSLRKKLHLNSARKTSITNPIDDLKASGILPNTYTHISVFSSMNTK